MKRSEFEPLLFASRPGTEPTRRRLVVWSGRVALAAAEGDVRPSDPIRRQQESI
nr:hypothetical protein [Bacillus velezensis]MDH3104055.1 hypothetical protein [Bacillus velezensis]MDH3138958.1 hypothetical protein [Bacillus velezensis]